jgi:ubiquinone/menaquinone biosynthesis C-methylase UbiE
MAREIQNILVNTIHDNALVRFASQYLSGRLIDIGCGIKPYKNMLAPYLTEHIGLDHKGTMHDKSNIDLFGNAYQIPVESAAFDSAICTAVLEHLEEPEKAIKETYRVLKAGGYAIYTVPFFWHLHEEPRDFYRFTKYGLKYLFEKNGFEIVELKPLSGFWVTFGQSLSIISGAFVLAES